MRQTLFLVLLCGAAACSAPPDPRQTGFAVERSNVVANYDKFTGRLSRLAVDQNKNGRMDTFSYWNGSRVLRIEIDKDEDGRIERWEHYDAANKIIKIGSSTRDDGVEDTWSYPDAIGFLARVETDTDRNGLIDKRETFVAKPGVPNARVLSVVELEINRSGEPKRRLHYSSDGQFQRSEVIRP